MRSRLLVLLVLWLAFKFSPWFRHDHDWFPLVAGLCLILLWNAKKESGF